MSNKMVDDLPGKWEGLLNGNIDGLQVKKPCQAPPDIKQPLAGSGITV